MKLSDDLTWRGLIKDQTFGSSDWLDEPKTFYLGIDASADSLTVGNLAVIILARRLAAAGWKAVLLMGGGTSLVGDPGGKTEERQLISREAVEKNIANVKAQTEKLFDSEKFEMLDNYDWLSKLKYVDFLRDVGKHFSMTELMQREFVTERMGSGGAGISYAEFSYSLVQGYDFWHLFKDHKVELQIGGSDQWGNMLSGVALIRKKEGKEVHALSMPLVVNKETGQKFGKSESGAIWLDSAKTTPTQFYQFWINTTDEDVENYLKVFTLLPKDQIEQAMADHAKDQTKRVAQKLLAEEVTKLVHGEASNQTATQKLKSGVSLVEALVQSGLAESNSDARRVIDEGGAYIDNEPTDKASLDAKDYDGGKLLLRRGKKLGNAVLIELE